MRGAWIMAAALVVFGTSAVPARAGVYNTAEPWPSPGAFNKFQGELAGYRAAAVDVPNRAAVAAWIATAEACPAYPVPLLGLAAPLAVETSLGPVEQSLGVRYFRRAAELERHRSQRPLTVEEQSNLGAYYIRLGNYQRAIAVLEPRARTGQFMLLANLATAYELTGQTEPADRARTGALEAWPQMYPGWDSYQLSFYRKAEQNHLTLLHLRMHEARAAGRSRQLTLDNLFPRVLFGQNRGRYDVEPMGFVPPARSYQAGGISPKRWADVPGDATDIVMQLLLWMPFDDRLHWLLGELLNASGDVIGAAAMMRPLVTRTTATGLDAGGSDELREHYRIVAAAAAAKEKYVEAVVADPYLNPQMLWAVAPRGQGVGVSDMVQVTTGYALASPPPPPAPQTTQQTAGSWLPSWWRQAAVGFGAGAVVAWLLGHQFRQSRLSKRG